MAAHPPVGETGHIDRIPCVVATETDLLMSRFKRVARLAAGLILSTGVLAGAIAPADATPSHDLSARAVMLDTGWGP
jgi:hypothetical protein